MAMNRLQRLILAVGSLALLLAVWTAPRVQHFQGGAVLKGGSIDRLANVVDVKSALVRGAAVLGAVGLLWFAASERK